jgi:hypothetical protein
MLARGNLHDTGQDIGQDQSSGDDRDQIYILNLISSLDLQREEHLASHAAYGVWNVFGPGVKRSQN